MSLSYPANFYQASLQSGVIGTYTLGGVFPTGMSYGCAVPETIGTTTFPNTSCVDSLGNPLTPEACTCLNSDGTEYVGCVAANAKCLGKQHLELERIYRQKTTANKWQAGYSTSTSALPAEHVDWGDNLEGKTWPIQVLRVETNTFSPVTPTVRFENWHVYGQGTTELWGVHATNPGTGNPLAYADTAFTYAVNVTGKAMLSLNKLDAGAASCPVTATGVSQSPFPITSAFDKTSGTWTGSAYSKSMLYGAELNIKGSYVYGYNWNLRNEPVPGGVNRAGWWRLTFYTTDDSVDFSGWAVPTTEKNTLAPPPLTGTVSPVVSAGLTVTSESEGETGLLMYVPQIDKVNQLTYLDICIKEGTAGGSGRKP